jgi:formylmethanofuran dehydrogenase subunit E
MKKQLEFPCSVPRTLMNDAVRFHGHLGASLVLGLKAGLFANEVLGKDPFRTRAIIEAEPSPPCSCFVDGVQIATGCTMGKGNIELKKGDSLAVTFMKDCERLRLTLKNEVLESLKRAPSMEESQKIAVTLAKKPIRDLFDIGK